MRRVVIPAALYAALVLSAAALAQGGSTIASAPQLPIGVNVVGGGTCPTTGCPPVPQVASIPNFYPEYYRVLALSSDQLTIDFGSTDGSSIQICMLDPTVTDYTLTDSQCVAKSQYTDDKSQFQFTFPSSGTWTLLIFGIGQTGVNEIAYQMTAYIKHYTNTTIAAPALVMHDGNVTYTGTVSGASGGQVELESRSLKNPAWKPFAIATISANGKFSYKTKVAAPGTYRIEAVYPGDHSHLPSSAKVSFKVI